MGPPESGEWGVAKCPLCAWIPSPSLLRRPGPRLVRKPQPVCSRRGRCCQRSTAARPSLPVSPRSSLIPSLQKLFGLFPLATDSHPAVWGRVWGQLFPVLRHCVLRCHGVSSLQLSARPAGVEAHRPVPGLEMEPRLWSGRGLGTAVPLPAVGPQKAAFQDASVGSSPVGLGRGRVAAR